MRNENAKMREESKRNLCKTHETKLLLLLMCFLLAFCLSNDFCVPLFFKSLFRALSLLLALAT